MRHKSFWLYWFPVILWAGVIFFFSSQPYHEQDLRPWIREKIPEEKVRERLGHLKLYYDGAEISVRTLGAAGFLEFFFRKGAHLFEYAVLGGLLLRAFLHAFPSGIRPVMFALLLSFTYAGTDELHQMFTGNRTPKWADVFLDACGSFLGLLFYLITRRCFRKKNMI